MQIRTGQYFGNGVLNQRIVTGCSGDLKTARLHNPNSQMQPAALAWFGDMSPIDGWQASLGGPLVESAGNVLIDGADFIVNYLGDDGTSNVIGVPYDWTAIAE